MSLGDYLSTKLSKNKRSLDMAAWKILLTDGLEENGQGIMRQSAEVVDRAGISADELLKVVGEYDALVVRGRTKVTDAVLAAAPQLKVVGRAGVGVDNIDLKAAKQRGVTVVNSPMATTIAVAELTLSLMLALVREIPRADSAMKNGKWLKKELEGTELWGKSLGIIGFGRIGQSVAKRAKAFDMNVVAICDPFVDCNVVNEAGCVAVSLEELLKAADIITLHVPLAEGTRSMLGREQFALMKDGVRIVDAARGGVIDEEALLEALESGKVAGAALDVFSTEPPGQTALVSHPRVIATPHIGAQTVEAQQRAANDIATEILAALRGDPLRWKVA
jgi:D-3-phosphoglycerate dehydrogenase / 2-oxoglutarate reductase